MMHGHEKSDLAIVAMKPANKANEPTAEASTGANAAELVERRAGAKGNAHQQSTHWTQSQARVSQALGRIRQAIAPRWEPYAGKPPVRFCAGGAMKIASLPLQTVSARQANHEFSDLLSRVERGEEILITKRNKPVAVLSPYRLSLMTPEREKAVQHAIGVMGQGLPWGRTLRRFRREEMHKR
jgi:prevent-host-death family protein